MMSFFGKDNGELVLINLQFKINYHIILYKLFIGEKKMAANVKKEAKTATADPPPSKVIENTPSPP